MRRSATTLLVLCSSLLLGACDGCSKTPASTGVSTDAAPEAAAVVSDGAHLDDAARKVLAEIATLETTKDVTCWTSFRQLDSFISAKEYSDFAVLAKTTAVKALVRAAWEKTSKATAGAELAAADFKQHAKLPEPASADREKLAQFASETLKLKAYKDYRTTSEHWRVLLSVIQDEIANGGPTPLKRLAPDGLAELAELSTRASLLLLQRSGQIAQDERTPFIDGPQVKKAHAELADKSGMRNAPRTASAATDETRKRLAPLTKALIDGKVKALLTFNKTSGTLLGDMNRLAKVPLAADGLEALRMDLQSFAHFVAAGHEPMQADNFLSDGQFAPKKLPTRQYIDAAFADTATLQLFPHLILPNGDLLLHFEPNPASPGKKDRKPYDVTIRDYEQNAVRDTALHWLVLQQVHGETPFAIDPFGAEYVSEVVSMMATQYLRKAEELAKAAGATEIHADVFKSVRDRQYVMTMPRPGNAPPAWTPEQEKKKRAALARYGDKLFRDVTAASGLPTIVPPTPPPDPNQMAHGIQEVMGAGIAVGDVDGDGFPDLFVAGDGRGKLYLNKGKAGPGKFVEATEAWGIPKGIDDSKHPILFDMDGDGDLDLLVIRSEHPSLLLMQDGKKFVDVTEKTGFKTAYGAHTATVLDYDRDGDLDLYVGYYGSEEQSKKGGTGRNLPSMDGKNGTPHQLWKRGPDGKYTEVGAAAGVADRGWTLAIGAFDYDNDGDLDLFLANDFGADSLYRNNGDGTFEDVSKATRTDDNGSGMNASFTDVNGDGWLDLYVSNIDMFSKNIKVVYPTDKSTLTSLDEQLATTFQYLSGNKLYVNPADKSGKKPFAAEEGSRFEPGDRGWGWTAAFFDYDNDGDDDMYLSNGWIDGSSAANQRNQMFVNDGGFFYLAPLASPEAFPGNSRSVVAFDMDRDGDLDLVVNNFRQPLVLLENTQAVGNHWVQLKVRQGGPNPSAIGARVTVDRTIREITCGNGYLGQDDDIVAIGIGAAKEASVSVRWPDGKVKRVTVPADRLTEIRP